METYDSKIESIYHQQHLHLERQLGFLPTEFTDAQAKSL